MQFIMVKFRSCFGIGRDIAIENNPINENNLYTFQTSYDYKGDNLALSESKYNGVSGWKIKALEYEVFQVILN